MGTPHVRCRLMHQSGRFSTIPRMRERPQLGHPAAPGRRSPPAPAPRSVASRPAVASSGRVHGDEPLRRGAEDDRVVAAPAVRVAVLDRVRRTVQQHAALDQELRRSADWRRRPSPRAARPAAPSRRSGRRRAPGCRCRGRTAGRPRSPPARGPARCAPGPCPARASRARRGPPPPAGRRRDDGRRSPPGPRRWRSRGCAGARPALRRRPRRPAAATVFTASSSGATSPSTCEQQILGHDDHPRPEVVEHVLEPRMHRDRQVGRQRPRGGGPDRRIYRLAVQGGKRLGERLRAALREQTRGPRLGPERDVDRGAPVCPRTRPPPRRARSGR